LRHASCPRAEKSVHAKKDISKKRKQNIFQKNWFLKNRFEF
jgi:hypothetical protein